MKQGGTLVLKTTVIVIGLVVLSACIYILTLVVKGEASYFLPVFVGMNIAAIPFFIGLYQALRLLTNIDKNNAFSESSVTALKYIKYCALIISGLYVALSPFIITVADKDDAPGAAAIGLVIIFASFLVSVFAALLQKLLQNGMEIKSENDLTV